MDKAVGKAKEAYGTITGDEAKKAEGRAEQAEKELDRQRRKDKGVLGDITDTGA
jgi:uncharacterized protein YjbJ (UPF0337 family)